MNVIVSNKNQSLLSTLDIDVIKSINGVFDPEEIVSQFKSFFYNKLIIDISALNNYENIETIRKLSLNMDMSNTIFLFDDSPKVNSPRYISQLVSMGIYNFSNKIETIKFLVDNPNSYKDVANYHKMEAPKRSGFNEVIDKSENEGFIGQRIIGIKNITEHAGATTLTFILKTHLEKHYKVKAVEIGARDFEYFNDKSLVSMEGNKFSDFVNNNKDLEVILVDLNNFETDLCTETLNLIEPGIIKLNKLIKRNYKIFEKLKEDKIILNRSVLDFDDIKDFERESRSEIFYNLPNLDDKIKEDEIVVSFLKTIGFSRFSEKKSNSGILGFF